MGDVNQRAYDVGVVPTRCRQPERESKAVTDTSTRARCDGVMGCEFRIIYVSGSIK
jgi:hypothetical protein